MTVPHPQTLVTCLFDLERRERTGRRSTEFYYRHATLVLEQELPLLAYADPEIAGWIRAQRDARGLGHLTRVVERPLESLPLYSIRSEIGSFDTFENAGPLKDTVLHQVIGWSKFDLLEESIAENPFASDHFAWIDFGIGHVARAPAQFPAPSKRVAMLQMMAVAPAEVADKHSFLRYERGKVAGGFLRGDLQHLGELIAAFRDELADALASHFRPNEQMLLAVLSTTRPELFECYYGDYQSILENWDGVRSGMGTILSNLVHCRLNGLWHISHAITCGIFESLSAGCLRLESEANAQLLDEAYIASWHIGRRDLAADIRGRFLQTAGSSTWFKQHRKRILGNFALLDTVPAGLIRQKTATAAHRAPLVSVIIPVHNGEAALERAVNSALGQTFDDLEVIVVDDGSTDGSLDKALALAAGNPRVQVLAREQCSGGPAVPRDHGISVSRGDFIALLDQDDYWLPEKLAAQLPLFSDAGTAVVYADAYYAQAEEAGEVPDAGTRPTRTQLGARLPEGDVLEALQGGDFIPCLTAVIRRDWLDRVGGFGRHGLLGVDDYYCWLRIAYEGGRFAAVHQPLAVHCMNPGSLGATREEGTSRSLRRMWEILADEYPG